MHCLMGHGNAMGSMTACLEFVLQVEWIHVECLDKVLRVLNPHGRTVKIDEEPLVRVEVE